MSQPLSNFSTPLHSNQKTGYVKLDQGFKTCLRAFRKALKNAFESAKLGRGKYHWTADRWVEMVTLFDLKYLGNSLSEQEKHAMCLLLFPTFGETAKKPANSTIFKGIASSEKERVRKMHLYHGIFENNTSSQRDEFFKDALIRKLWRISLPFMTKEVCFKKDEIKDNCFKALVNITLIISEKYELDLPQWWIKQFSPNNAF